MVTAAPGLRVARPRPRRPPGTTVPKTHQNPPRGRRVLVAESLTERASSTRSIGGEGLPPGSRASFLGRPASRSSLPTRASPDSRLRWHARRRRRARPALNEPHPSPCAPLPSSFLRRHRLPTPNPPSRRRWRRRPPSTPSATPSLASRLATEGARRRRPGERATLRRRVGEPGERREFGAGSGGSSSSPGSAPESGAVRAGACAELPGESRLVPAAAGGAGTVAASFAHRVRNRRKRRAEKRRRCERLEREAAGGSNDREEPGSPDERPEESNPAAAAVAGGVGAERAGGVGSDAARRRLRRRGGRNRVPRRRSTPLPRRATR